MMVRRFSGRRDSTVSINDWMNGFQYWGMAVLSIYYPIVG
jgi:hypothetical protein